MCGIFGAIGDFDAGRLDAVARAMYHRGPDDEGRFVDGSGREQAALLFRRLRIIDLTPAGAQPMPNEDGSVQLVFNGEIYNHHALRDELVARGHRFRSRSDTETIVHGYEEWGDAVIDRIEGMFALAIWDRPRRRLLLARDRAGKKPLYFSDEGGVFRFGSTIATLHAAGLPRTPDPAALPYFLSFGWVPPPGTFYAGVRQLGAGEVLIRERDGSVTQRVYWEPRFLTGTTEGVDALPTAIDKVRALVTAAVERRLEADVPLGAFLSGGIDSTIVVGVMAERLGRKVQTFSIGFTQDPRFDETAYARMAAEAFGCQHTEFTLEPSSMDLIEKLVEHHDGPFGDSSAIPTWVVSQLTRRSVTVALTGDGGDELFCGYERFLAAELAERIPPALREVLAAASVAMPPAAKERSFYGRARRFLGATELPLDERMVRWNSFFPRPRKLMRGDFALALGEHVEDPVAWQQRMFARSQAPSVLGRVLEHNFRTYLFNDLLVKADRCSMAHSLELRSPFLDTPLFDYVARLPPHYLRRGLTTKWILKTAFADLLPRAIRRRGKMGFGVPLATWFRGSLRGYLQDMLAPSARLFDYLDERSVRTLLDDHLAGRDDHGQRLWALLTLELWLRSFAAAPMRLAA